MTPQCWLHRHYFNRCSSRNARVSRYPLKAAQFEFGARWRHQLGGTGADSNRAGPFDGLGSRDTIKHLWAIKKEVNRKQENIWARLFTIFPVLHICNSSEPVGVTTPLEIIEMEMVERFQNGENGTLWAIDAEIRLCGTNQSISGNVSVLEKMLALDEILES